MHAIVNSLLNITENSNNSVCVEEEGRMIKETQQNVNNCLMWVTGGFVLLWKFSVDLKLLQQER